MKQIVLRFAVFHGFFTIFDRTVLHKDLIFPCWTNSSIVARFKSVKHTYKAEFSKFWTLEDTIKNRYKPLFNTILTLEDT